MNTKSDSHIIQTIYKSRKTLLEYLSIQGFNTNDYTNFSITEINTLSNNYELDMLVEHTGSKNKTYVKYHLKKSLKQSIDEYIDDLYNLEQVLTSNDTLIIVTKDDPNESLITHIKHIYSNSNIYIAIFSLKRLQFNVLNHSLVPTHTKLTEEEVEIVKKRYNIIDYNKFPEISRFDPIALAIGLRPGEVCKIIRHSKTAVSGLYFRYCINV